MKTTSSLSRWLVGLSLALSACGPLPARIDLAVADHADPLTSSSGDRLFTLTLSKAAQGYATSNLMVTAGQAGQTPTSVNFTLDDKNGNGQLDEGEALTCAEPPVNLFDATTVGKTLNVTLDENESGSWVVIGSAQWTPAN